MATTTPRIISLPSALEDPLSSSKSVLGEADGDGALEILLLVALLVALLVVVLVLLLLLVLVLLLVALLVVALLVLVLLLLVVVVLVVVAVTVAVVARGIVEESSVGGSVMSSPQLVTVRRDR